MPQQKQCVILAGGLGTRMRPLTEVRPKNLIPIAGKPFVDYQLEWLAAEGITEVVFCIGHLGEMIRAHVGDGSRWNLRVSYVDEGTQLRGTAGALRLALDSGVLHSAFAVMYGDSFLRMSVSDMWSQYLNRPEAALMAVLRNDNRWDQSNVLFENPGAIVYDKTRQHAHSEEMRHIDYGFSILSRDVIERLVAPGQVADLANIFRTLSDQHLLGGFEVSERFYEIGSPDGLRDFECYTSRAHAIRSTTLRSEIGILGGGLSGLTVAAHLQQDCEVLEADSQPGGHCLSVVEQGFTFDAGGPHIIFSRNPKTLDFMLSLLEGNISRGRRNNKIFYNGRYVKYPFENGLFDLAAQDRFECLRDYISNAHPAPTNFKQWMYRTFGTSITEKYLLPYNEKIWKVPADQMSLDWVEGRIPKPPVEDVIKAAVGVETEGYQHQLFFSYPAQGGIQSLPEAMAKRVSRLTTDFCVQSVRRTGDRWAVSDGDREYYYNQLVSTLPINEMAHKFEGVPNEIKACADALRFNSLITVTVGLASERHPDYSAIYVPAPELPFHRLSFPAIFSVKNAPGGKSLIQAEITCIPGGGMWPLADSEILKRVIDGLCEMDLIRSEEICYSKVIRTKYGYVVQDFTYRKYLEKVKSYFEQEGITLCGRNAQFEYINMDQCIEGAQRAAAQLNERNRTAQTEALCLQ